MKKILFIIILLILILIIFMYKNTKMESDYMGEIEKEIIINDKTYKVIFNDNESVKELLKLDKLEFVMEDLNNNEKYVYLDTNIKTNSYNPKKINSGDIMLYGSNCLVIFYKSFNTSYSYTYLGHIDNLEQLDSDKINVLIK